MAAKQLKISLWSNLRSMFRTLLAWVGQESVSAGSTEEDGGKGKNTELHFDDLGKSSRSENIRERILDIRKEKFVRKTTDWTRVRFEKTRYIGSEYSYVTYSQANVFRVVFLRFD
jgi:hypothetical protein